MDNSTLILVGIIGAVVVFFTTILTPVLPRLRKVEPKKIYPPEPKLSTDIETVRNELELIEKEKIEHESKITPPEITDESVDKVLNELKERS